MEVGISIKMYLWCNWLILFCPADLISFHQTWVSEFSVGKLLLLVEFYLTCLYIVEKEKNIVGLNQACSDFSFKCEEDQNVN